MRRLGLAFVLVGVMLLGAGVAFGFAGVNVTAVSSCGNAFSAEKGNSFTDVGDEACATARSERKPWTAALLTAGLLGLLLGAAVAAAEPKTQKEAPTPSGVGVV